MSVLNHLIIEYVFEGHKRGYNFTTPTHAYDDTTLKTIWKHAMPRGQGWGADHFIGSRAIKCFPLPDDRIAISETIVTDLADETGRRGIRRAVIETFRPIAINAYFRARLATYDLHTQNAANILHNRVYHRFPNKNQPLIISYPYKGLMLWRVVEALIFQLMLNMPRQLQNRSNPYHFTTLALDYRDESPIVVLPTEKTSEITDFPVLILPS